MPPNLSKPSSDLESKNKQKTVIICLKIKKKLKEGDSGGSGAAESNGTSTLDEYLREERKSFLK